jgi:hypothetical protein
LRIVDEGFCDAQQALQHFAAVEKMLSGRMVFLRYILLWLAGLLFCATSSLAGCIAAEAQGAAGGIAGAIYSGMQKAPDPGDYNDASAYNAAYANWQADVSARADLLGGVSAWVFSGGKAENVSAGHSVMTSGVANNYLRHEQWVDYLERLSTCKDEAGCLQEAHAWAEDASLTNQHGFLMCREMGTCEEHYAAIEAAAAAGLRSNPMASDLVNTLQKWSYGASRNPNITHGTVGNSSVLDLTGLGDGKGTLSYYDFANANCNGVAGATCVAAFHSLTDNLRADRDLTNTLVTLGLAGGLIGSAATPQLAALCMANQTCTTTYLAFEGAGTITDLAACASGDPVACAGAAIPVATTGGMGDRLVGAGNRTIIGPDVDPTPPTQSVFAPGSAGAAKVWAKTARLKDAQLPNQGHIRFVPPRNWDGSTPIPRGPNKGFLDRFGNEWTRGPSRTQGQAFEWDVQLSPTGRSQEL